MTELKKAIIAQHGDDFILAAYPYGNLMCCGPEMIEIYRKKESLVGVDTLLEAMHGRAERDTELRGVTRSAEELFIRDATVLFHNTLTMLGWPPFEEIDFFSTPDDIVKGLRTDYDDWRPKTY